MPISRPRTNLESYHDYENWLPRGRTYVCNGSVVDLQIAPRETGAACYRARNHPTQKAGRRAAKN
jgi:hypothetical protein